MRILLDNNVSPKLGQDLPGHEVRHVRDLGWSEYLNGALVRAANEQFDVLVTADKNMPNQTNLRGLRLAVAVLDCKTNRLEDLRPLLPARLTAIANLRSGEYTWIRPGL